MRRLHGRGKMGRALLALAAALPLAGCLQDRIRVMEGARTDAFDLLTRGQALKAGGDYLLARDFLVRSAERSPRPAAFYEVGNCYYHLENYEQALAWYDKALALAPDYELARAERDLAAARLGDAEAASAMPRETPIIIPGDQETGPTLQLRPTPQPTPERIPVAEKPPEPPREEPAPAPEPPVLEAEAVAEVVPPQPSEPAPAPEVAPEQPQGTSPATPGGLLGGLSKAFTSVAAAEAEKTNPADIDPERLRLAIFPELYRAEDEQEPALRAGAAEAERLGRQDEAARLWRRVLEDSPEDVEARLRLAKALQRSGRSWRAQEEIALAEKLSPSNAQVQFDKGTILLAEDDRAGAEAALRRAVELDPGHAGAQNNLAVIESDRGDARSAEARLEKVVAQNPDFAAAWLNLARAQDQQGRPAATVLRSLENHVRLSPESSEKTARWLRTLRQRALLKEGAENAPGPGARVAAPQNER